MTTQEQFDEFLRFVFPPKVIVQKDPLLRRVALRISNWLFDASNVLRRYADGNKRRKVG